MVGIVLDVIVQVMLLQNVVMEYVTVMKPTKHATLIVMLQENVVKDLCLIVQTLIVVLKAGLVMDSVMVQSNNMVVTYYAMTMMAMTV
jgi:hypothetical protein